MTIEYKRTATSNLVIAPTNARGLQLFLAVGTWQRIQLRNAQGDLMEIWER